MAENATAEKIKKAGLDRPLEEFKDDFLERKPFAEKIFKIIESNPLDLNIRIGINGPWGSGKTTVLNFIKSFCEEGKYPYANFNPWHYSNPEMAWEGFALSVDSGLSKWKKKKMEKSKK